MFILSFLFFLTALIYSSVGFGGGSTYLVLLLIWGIPYQIFPLIALCCNIIVVSGNCFNFIREGNANFKLVTPYLISSIPLAFIGGSLEIQQNTFEGLEEGNATFISKFGEQRYIALENQNGNNYTGDGGSENFTVPSSKTEQEPASTDIDKTKEAIGSNTNQTSI